MADALLRHEGTNLVRFLDELHRAGEGYEEIAKKLYTRTDGVVSISYQTVKRWLVDFDLLQEAS